MTITYIENSQDFLLTDTTYNFQKDPEKSKFYNYLKPNVSIHKLLFCRQT